MPSKPKVLVTRDLPGDAISRLRERFQVDLPTPDEEINHGRLVEHLVDKQGLLCLLTDRIDAEVLANAPLLKVISVCAVGYNNVDVKEATRRGILVTNTPGVLRETTADLAWALLLAAARRIPEGDRMVRSGRFGGWSPSLLLGHDVHGKTLGIIGMGDIGTAVARRAAGFGMRILYHNRNPSPLAAEVGAEMVSLDHLLSNADFVSLHVPLSQSTRHLIGKRELDMMKPTAILINVSRGEVIDEAALVEALKKGWIASAGLDVFENEPRMAEGLVELDNVVLTPHIGSASVETRERMAQMAVKDLVDGLEGRRPPHLVNPEAYRG
jgi:glyoxylate reductase